MSFNITPVASGYQEIHPYSAMNIDSVKINTSLIMMKECTSLRGKHCQCSSNDADKLNVDMCRHLTNMDGSIERITIYKGEYCSSEERLHYIYIPTSLVKKETSLPGFFFVVQFGREIG